MNPAWPPHQSPLPKRRNREGLHELLINPPSPKGEQGGPAWPPHQSPLPKRRTGRACMTSSSIPPLQNGKCAWCMGTFYVFPDRGVCLWAICADGVGILPLLPCHDRPTVDEVREADHLLMWEVLGMVIQVGQVSSSVWGARIPAPCATRVYNKWVRGNDEWWGGGL